MLDFFNKRGALDVERKALFMTTGISGQGQ